MVVMVVSNLYFVVFKSCFVSVVLLTRQQECVELNSVNMTIYY